MLRQRIITALLLLAVLLPAMLYPSTEPFAALATVMVVAAGWEWARLNGCTDTLALGMGAALGGVVLIFWWWNGLERQWPMVWLVASAAWSVLALVMLRRGVSGWVAWSSRWRLLGGMLLLACAWLALVQAHAQGVVFLLSVLTLVWAADIAAYAGGRAFGRRKLAPSLSPGKSWEGVFSGGLGVCLLAWFWIAFDQRHPTASTSLFSQLWDAGWLWTLSGVVFMTATSVVGDLLESLVKRGAGMKDSSQLLPGHGGVLDRVDALLPVLPLAMWLTNALQP